MLARVLGIDGPRSDLIDDDAISEVDGQLFRAFSEDVTGLLLTRLLFQVSDDLTGLR